MPGTLAAAAADRYPNATLAGNARDARRRLLMQRAALARVLACGNQHVAANGSEVDACRAGDAALAHRQVVAGQHLDCVAAHIAAHAQVGMAAGLVVGGTARQEATAARAAVLAGVM